MTFVAWLIGSGTGAEETTTVAAVTAWISWANRRVADSRATFTIHRPDRLCGIVGKRKRSKQLALDAGQPI